MPDPHNVFCEHIKIGDRPLFDDDVNGAESAQVETTPAFRCSLIEQPCKYATRKQSCPTYQEYLKVETDKAVR